MAKSGRRAHLARALDSYVQTIKETFQMLDKPAASSLEKVDWSEVTKLGDEISKQATVAGMLWSGDNQEVKELEENMGAYFNVLHGFLLICHGTTVGAGPTLHSNINASVKQVIDCSLTLLREAVSSYDNRRSGKGSTIPQLSGAVWEACTALKKTPTTNCTAIGRAITQVAVSVKDILREMKELKPAAASTTSAADLTDATPDEGDEGSSDSDLGDDLSPEEMTLARLATDVVASSLELLKEVIRFVSGLLKSMNQELDTLDCVESLERLLKCCQEIGSEVNELGASVYPPQEISEMKSVAKKIGGRIDEIRIGVERFKSSKEKLFMACEGLESSLRRLESGLGGDLVTEMSGLGL